MDDSGTPQWRGFIDHLTVNERSDGTFEGWCLPGRGTRPYGGHILAQSLQLVVQKSARGMTPMSLHAHFMAAGDTRTLLEYKVTSMRSGRSFEHWAVDVSQGGRPLVAATVVLHHPEPSPEHQVRPQRPGGPNGLPVITQFPRAGTVVALRAGLEIRAGRNWTQGDPAVVPYQDRWYRCVEPVPEGWEDAVLAWCTDLESTWTVDLPYLDGVRSRTAASLDHNMHFHRPFDPSQWWLYEQESPDLFRGRGLATGRIFSLDGALIATVTQQTLLRLELED
jgi:acyl-CoA thioesterase-2